MGALNLILLNLPVVLVTVAIGFLIPYISNQRKRAVFPLLNKSRDEYIKNARGLLEKGAATVDGPFRLQTDEDINLFLPPSYAEYIKNDKRMSFPEATARSFPNVKGFEPFGDNTRRRVAVDVVQKKITNNIGALTPVISTEMTAALQDQWTDNKEWHQIDLRQTVLKMVARLSSQVFVGPQLAHDENWLRLSIDYTVDSFMAAKEIRKYPKWTRPVVHWFLPRCQRVRASMAEARSILKPIIAEREKERAANGGKADHFDSIEWFHELKKDRRADPVVSQVGLALAAIHTTTDLLSKSVHQIASHPQVLKDVREEISSVLKTHGWNKTGMFNMKLLDSIVKETQRMESIALVSMGRLALEDVLLPNGVLIPKGMRTAVIASEMRDEKIHKNADVFDAYRFYNMRQNGLESKAQLVSVTKDHLAFGYGMHACPGRFFAAHEIKIALAHILMKYDVEYFGGDKKQAQSYGFELLADTSSRLQVRRRREEAIL